MCVLPTRRGQTHSALASSVGSLFPETNREFVQSDECETERDALRAESVAWHTQASKPAPAEPTSASAAPVVRTIFAAARIKGAIEATWAHQHLPTTRALIMSAVVAGLNEYHDRSSDDGGAK